MDPKIFQLSITPKGQKEIYSVKLTKGMYTYTLKLTKHLEHFFYLTTASRLVLFRACNFRAI